MVEERHDRPRMFLLRPAPILFGALTGLGAAVLLQQAAVTPLTTLFLVSMIIAGILVIGIALPTLLMHIKGTPQVEGRRPPGRTTAVSIVAIITVLAFALVTFAAQAEVEGPCTASIDGERVDEQMTLPANGTIDWSLTSHSGNIAEWEILLHYAFLHFTLEEGSDDPPVTQRKQGSENINDYPGYGVGAYRLTGSLVDEHGAHCTGTVDVIVPGNPFTAPIGATATALTLVGIAGGSMSANHAANETTRRPRRPGREPPV